MPVNAGPKYFKAEEKYLAAKSRDERIAALEEMIRELPKHKGTENVLAQLRRRLANLKKETVTQAKSKPKFVVKKEGAAQVCIIGKARSGKSSLLRALTNADVEVSDHGYTTVLPTVGMMDYEGIGIQLVEIPSTFDTDALALVQTCDLVLILLDGTLSIDSQLEEIIKVMESNRLEQKKLLITVNKADIGSRKGLCISAKTGEGIDELKNEIWGRLGLMRVYTKSPNKPRIGKPLALPAGSTVRDVTKMVHKTMLKDFKFARIFNSAKHSGQKVGLDYRLSDLDTVEIHTG